MDLGWPKCTDCADFFLPINCTDSTECTDNVSNCLTFFSTLIQHKLIFA